MWRMGEAAANSLLPPQALGFPRRASFHRAAPGLTLPTLRWAITRGLDAHYKHE